MFINASYLQKLGHAKQYEHVLLEHYNKDVSNISQSKLLLEAISHLTIASDEHYKNHYGHGFIEIIYQ